MKYSNTVEYNISTKLDSSGLTQLQTQIKQIELNMQRMANRDLLPKGRVEEAKAQLEGLSSALTKSFDSSLGMLNLAQFRSELQQSKVTAEGLKSAFSMTGSQGVEAFGNLAKQIGNFNNGIERSSSSLDKMFTTFSNTFRWGLVSSFFSQFMNAIHSSIDYVKELDDSLTQIMLVTDYNRDSMNQFAKSANEAAKAVSMTTTGMTNASLIFAQQGYDLGQSQELATLSAKLANASQQDTATTSDQITAYMNAYGLENSIDELTQAMDNWALIANISAADVGELAQASQRAASMANTVGVSGEQLAAQIATIESVTREAPEQIGNGLKTLYARFSDISAGGEDEEGVSLGDVTKQLNDIGVRVLDQFGNIRDVGDIMEDLMFIWDDLDQTSKIAAAQSLAGKYQVNRFVSLMDNSDMYREYLGATGSSATGTLDQMNQEYAESLAGRTQKLSTTVEGIFNNLFNTDTFYPFIDIAQKALDLVDNLTEAMGGGLPVLTALVSGFTQLFSTNIARGINDMMSNQQIAQTRQSNLANVKGALADTGLDQTGVGQYIQAGADRAGIMNGEQYNIYTDQLDNYITAATNAAKANEHLQDTYMLVAAAAGQVYKEGENLLFKDEEGINTSALIEELNRYKDSKALMSDLSKVDFSVATESATSFSKALSQLNGDLDRIKTKDRSGGDDWDIEQAENDLYRVNDALTDLGKAGALTKDDFETMQKTVQNAFNDLAEGGEISEDVAKDLDSMNITIARFSEALQRIGPETLAKGPEAIQAAIMQEVAALQAEAAAAQGAEGVISNLDRQNVVNSVVTLTSSLGQLASAWMTIQNLGSIWSDENLSGGEKFLQTILNLSMIIGQVTSAFNQLGKAQKTISTLYEKINSVTEKNAEALKKNADAARQAAESSTKDTAAKTADTAAKTVNTTVTEKESNENKELAVTENMTAEGAVKDAAAQTADTVAKTGATAATTGLTVAVGALKGALDLLAGPVGILITIFGMIAGAAWGAYQANIEQMKEEAQAAFDEAKSNLEQIEALKEKTSAFGEKYTAFKETGESGNELTQQARDIAQALKDAGAEEQANALHLAILSAEARGTAESFSVLAQEIENAQVEAEKQANEDVIESSVGVLGNQDVLAKDVLNHQKMIKEYQEELNNLDPLDAGYEAEKERLEHLIDTLQNAKLAQEDLVNAANEYQQAQGKLAGMTVAENQGLNLYAGGQQGKRMNPEDAMYFENADLDYNSINRIYSNMVEGFSDLSNLEQAQFILETIGDEAGEAAAQVELLMLNFNNLDTNQIDHLQNEMAQSGFTHNQQQLLSASLDPDTTAAEFSQTIQNIAKNMSDNGTSFEIALKAEIGNPEEFQEAIRQQVESYQPLDTEIKQEDYDAMTEHFYENKDRMGEEGSGFENYSEDLFDNAEALSEVIEDTLRYSDAIEEISDNFDDWTDILNKGEKTSKEYVDAVDGLKDTFSDFLGIPEELSEEFVTTQENLNDLQLAAEGDVDAFERLQTAAAIDLAEQLGVDSDVAIAAVNEIQGALDTLGYSEIDIGETITFSDEALAQINNALDMLELDADQAAQFIESAFGFKVAPGQFEYVKNDMADVEQTAADTGAATAENMTVTPEITTASAEQVATDEKNYTDVVPDISSKTWTATLPVTGGGIGSITTASTPAPVPISGSVPVITYNATPKTATETKKDTALATGVKAEQGGSGVPKNSHVNLKPGSTGTRTGGRAPSSSAPRPSSGGGGGGGGKGSCFVAGTLITTQTSFKPIEQIQKGDIVLSYNEQIGFNQYSKVVQTMIHDTIEPIYTLYIKNEQLRVTGIHRFFVTDKITCGIPQWVCAADLHVGQWVLFADGTWHVIHKIEVNIEHQTVYNFEVSGNHNYYVGRNQILAHNKGGGGGGKGSTPKTIEPKEKKDHQKDYYEEVKNQLDKTEKVLSKIEKEEDRLIGDKARANQNKQLKLLQKEIDLNEKKLKINKQELKDVDEKIKKEIELAKAQAGQYGVNTNIPEIKYDEDGVISNYEEISAAIDRIHNELIDKYNEAAAASNEELTKEIQKAIDKFDKYGDSVLKNAQRHNALQSEIEETKNAIEELKDSIEDIRIDIYKAHQEAIDDLKELREDGAELASLFKDFNKDGFLSKWHLEDTPIDDMTEAMYKLDNIYNVSKKDAEDFYQTIINKKKADLKNAKTDEERNAIQSSIDFFTNQQKNLSDNGLNNGLWGLANKDLEQLQGWIDGTNKAPNPFGDNEAALWEAYQDAYKRATDYFKDYRKTVQDLRDSILDSWDAQEEAIEKNLDNYDRIAEKLERISDTYVLYYGEDSYDNILAIMDRQGASMEQHLKDLDKVFKYWQGEYQKALENGDEKLIEETKAKMDKAEDAMLDKAEELAEHWVERFETAVDASIKKMSTKVWGGGQGQMDLEDQTMIWELQKDYMETYKDDIEKTYEVEKLRSKYVDLLNDAQGMSLQTQNKIKAQMQEQLDLLQNQKTVSEYDVKLANAKLEVLQKQIALEDAQRNKNKMQLRRDTQGNYRYVYSADQGDVKKAQDELNESQFDMYEITKEQTIANNDRAINLFQDYMNKMRDIANKYKDDDVARNEALKALSEEYGKLLEALGEDFKNTTSGMYEVLTWMVENGTQNTADSAIDMLNQLYEKNGEVKENTGNDWRDLATQISEEVLPQIEDEVLAAISEIDINASDLADKLAGDNGVLSTIGSSVDKLGESLKGATDQTEKWAAATRELFESFGSDSKQMQDAMKQLEEMEKQLQTNQQATSALALKYREANAQLQAKTAEALNYKTQLDEIASGKRDKNGNLIKNQNNGGKNGGGGSLNRKRVEEVYDLINRGVVGNEPERTPNLRNKGYSDREIIAGQALINHAYPIELRGLEWDYNIALEHVLKNYDTGGYTGQWNDGNKNAKNGKLAVLHQKELVLNATDTQNILAAVSMIRKLSFSNQGTLKDLSIAGTNNISSTYNPTTEQRVEIQASFPNVTDVDDIRQALIGLSDKAYQYAHRVI